ncbi:MAG: hypothetical protein JST43_08120 [Bacteroidetes bacterium]|nr:hypothetical protein [Bacteroidota bacterium]MBS1539212.1 hypothetical protein [Bacteroidota bacterium]
MDHNLREVLMPIAILGSISAGVYFFASVMTNYILKKKMIEKGFVNEDTQAIFKQHVSENKYASLKWGLLAFFVGVSLIIMEYIPVQPQSPLPYGVLFVAVSLGFLIYFFIVKKSNQK